jgi:ubiquinone/menaquinone biosynthesis C-methylase UbiE
MQRAEFDKFAEEYKSLHRANIAMSGEGPDYFSEYKIKDLTRIVQKSCRLSDGGLLLDFGSGVGSSVPYFSKYFPVARLVCTDISEESLKLSASTHGNAALYVTCDGASLPFADNSFDVAFSSCVFHHISHTAHLYLLRELRRVLKPKGIIMIYEHNPINPLTVRAVNSCPFDENAVLIYPGALKASLKSAGFLLLSVRYRVFFPKFLSGFRWIENWIKWLPLGAQYFVIASK